MTDIRVTRQALEVVGITTATPDVRVTRQALEVVGITTSIPDVRITRLAIEVVGSVAQAALGGAVRRLMSVNYV